ncbi:hypothetical protein GCG54_00009993 [Colletotrichum gloeosporioides]|uniref:Uncharacterized protein n=1 Tax=Colletotrichum gloeosporioides TaxID=474922 RepID=A0A8H4FG69_COLGL|nr:uncharacterized protein GCG54_00009993 [Colletotrichum gloeosporioides]KAF3799804.1 hypothetical protein GCG54_00009993 [Colletotrichum gloeosporioides]
MSSDAMTALPATFTLPLTITTPFVAPSDCSTQWRTTSVHLPVTSGTSLKTPILVYEPSTSCYPSGSFDLAPENRLNFRPGVCPDGWVYHNMAVASSGASTAYCCDRFVSIYATSIFAERCGRYASASAFGATVSGDKTLMVHEAWAVTWCASDTPTLTPQLPTLTNSMFMPVWTPGDRIPDGIYDHDEGKDGNAMSKTVHLVFLIGLPIIAAIIICLVIWCGVRKYRRSSRKKRELKARRGKAVSREAA